MPRIAYKNINLQKKKLEVISRANTIIEDYLAQGFFLTLRQL